MDKNKPNASLIQADHIHFLCDGATTIFFTVAFQVYRRCFILEIQILNGGCVREYKSLQWALVICNFPIYFTHYVVQGMTPPEVMDKNDSSLTVSSYTHIKDTAE